MLTEQGIMEFIKEWRVNVKENFALNRGETDSKMLIQLQETFRDIVKDDDDLVNKFHRWIEQYEGGRNPQMWMFRKYLRNQMRWDETEKKEHQKPSHLLCQMCKGMGVIVDIMLPYNDRTGEYFPDPDFYPGDVDYIVPYPYRMERTTLPCMCQSVNISPDFDTIRERYIEYFSEKKKKYESDEEPGVRIRRMKSKIGGLTERMLTDEAKEARGVNESRKVTGTALEEAGVEVPEGEMPDCFKEDTEEGIKSAIKAFGSKNSDGRILFQ